MIPIILPFESSDAILPVVGGKGANLSRLWRANFPVPPGFIITTATYDAFVRANCIREQILTLASDSAQSAAEASTAIRQLFERGGLPYEQTTAIRSAYAGLLRIVGDTTPVAVRSSATAEDLVEASFAGQQESYLNVRGEQALLDAVKLCWSSLWTPRALDYRARHGVAPGGVSLAVVVQAMVMADAAGTLFTANPLSGERDECVLEAAWGLGEAIVGGLVTPDHIVADKRTGAVKQASVGDKAVMTEPAASGTHEREVEESRRRQQVLNPGQVAELVKLGGAIESHYGAPQDIEWCFANGTFYIVQARPITTLPAEPLRWESPIAGAKWQKDVQVAEWIREPPSPLGATTTLASMVNSRQLARSWPPVPKQRAPWFTLINGWFYLRVDHKPGSVYAFLIGTALSAMCGGLDGHRRAQRGWPRRLALLDEMERVKLDARSESELRAHADRLLIELGWWWLEVTWFAAAGRSCMQLMERVQVPGITDTTVLFLGNDSLLLEAERALRRASNDPGQVESYLARFGQAVESADPVLATLRESPEHLAWQLAAARNTESGPDERLAGARRRREAAEASVKAMKGLRGAIAGRLLAIGQSHAAHTDDAVFHFQRVLAAVRAGFLEAGRRLVRSGILLQVDDVFYLERDELWAATAESTQGLMATVIQRRDLRDRNKRLAPPPFIPPATDPAWANDPFFKLMPHSAVKAMFERGVRERDGKLLLIGSPGSPGCARGIARVIRGPEDFGKFNKGDVLVARATSPIWTPLLGIAAAAVTEVGGQFSHAAIVAREFGIPLVDGALDATRVIQDGTPVVVDGSAGTVQL